jgi:hypothetical protein
MASRPVDARTRISFVAEESIYSGDPERPRYPRHPGVAVAAYDPLRELRADRYSRRLPCISTYRKAPDSTSYEAPRKLARHLSIGDNTSEWMSEHLGPWTPLILRYRYFPRRTDRTRRA